MTLLSDPPLADKTYPNNSSWLLGEGGSSGGGNLVLVSSFRINGDRSRVKMGRQTVKEDSVFKWKSRQIAFSSRNCGINHMFLSHGKNYMLFRKIGAMNAPIASKVSFLKFVRKKEFLKLEGQFGK